MNLNTPVAVVVVSYNTRNLLLECLGSVVDSTPLGATELVVIDNASSDRSYEAVLAAYPQAITIRNSTNLGFAAASNQGIRATDAPLILLLNSDAKLSAKAFQALLDCMERNDRCGAAGCKLTDARGMEVINARNFLTPLNQALEMAGIRVRSRRFGRTHRLGFDRELVDCSVDWIDGACLMLRRAALDQVGIFDERFFMYSEDEDLCFRLRKQGWLVCLCGRGTAVHRGGASSEPKRAAMLRHFYLSQMLFLSKHRGRLSALCYSIAMKTVLVLKHWFLRDSRRRQRTGEQLMALRGVRVSKTAEGTQGIITG